MFKILEAAATMVALKFSVIFQRKYVEAVIKIKSFLFSISS